MFSFALSSRLDAFRNHDDEVCRREAPINSCSCDVFVLARILLDVLLTRSVSIKIVFVKRDRARKKRPREIVFVKRDRDRKKRPRAFRKVCCYEWERRQIMSLAATSTFSQLRKHENDSLIGHARRSMLRRTDDGFPCKANSKSKGKE